MTDPRALAEHIAEALAKQGYVTLRAHLNQSSSDLEVIERVLRAHQDAHPRELTERQHEHRRPDGDGPLLARNAEHDNAATQEIASQRADVHAPLAASGRCGQPTPEAGSNPADALSLQLAACGEARDRLRLQVAALESMVAELRRL